MVWRRRNQLYIRTVRPREPLLHAYASAVSLSELYMSIRKVSFRLTRMLIKYFKHVPSLFKEKIH